MQAMAVLTTLVLAESTRLAGVVLLTSPTRPASTLHRSSSCSAHRSKEQSEFVQSLACGLASSTFEMLQVQSAEFPSASNVLHLNPGPRISSASMPPTLCQWYCQSQFWGSTR